ncbi:hypothetical protein EON68_04375 [archaeon]|nr:MAG: hypothetical protein EON68_04375 [archaeon]
MHRSSRHTPTVHARLCGCAEASKAAEVAASGGRAGAGAGASSASLGAHLLSKSMSRVADGMATLDAKKVGTRVRTACTRAARVRGAMGPRYTDARTVGRNDPAFA